MLCTANSSVSASSSSRITSFSIELVDERHSAMLKHVQSH
jgi:hypothetical protein